MGLAMARDELHDGDGLLAIGAFSRASGLSIKTLRAYHEGGILVPDRVDGRTGYRAYSPAQLSDAAVIVRLRALDVPLEQVRQVLHARDPSLTRQVLEEHRSVMQARLEATVRIVAELQSGVAPLTLTPVHVREEPATHSLRIAATLRDDELWPWLDDAFATLEAAARDASAAVAGPRTALYLPEIADDGIEHVEAVVPVSDPPPGALPPGVALGEVPIARTAVLVHAGGYDDIGDTYRALGAWVGRHAEPSGERIRERYVLGGPDGVAPDAYRTEICWPIR
jgi:DNA-binding transcriptional MerR regulator